MQPTEPLVPFVLAQRACTETVIGLSAAMFESLQKLVALNLQVARDTMTEIGQAPQVMYSLTNPPELMTLPLSWLQSQAQKVASYGHGLQEIASAAGSELSQVVRAGTAQVQSTLLAADERSTDDAAVSARKAMGQDPSGMPSAHNASSTSSRRQKSERPRDPAGVNDPATNTNGRRAHDGSKKSPQRSGRSGAGRHGT